MTGCRAYIRRMFLSPIFTLAGVNAAMFVVLRLIAIGMRFWGDGTVDSGRMVEVLAMPADAVTFLSQPWSALSYMFVQYEPMHLIMNVLWLVLFGKIAERTVGAGHVYVLYLAGGLAGAAVYVGASALGIQAADGPGYLVGASAAILSLITAPVVMCPSMQLRLPFFGNASLRVVGLIALLLLIISVGPENYGTHAAHCGGIACGAYLALRWRRRKMAPSGVPDVAGRRVAVANSVAAPVGKAVDETAPEDATLDELLDKIRLSGFGSLTEQERARLFKISSDLQNTHRR